MDSPRATNQRHATFDWLPCFDPYGRRFGRDRYAEERLTLRPGATFVEYHGAVADFIASGMVRSAEVPGEPQCAHRETHRVRRSDCRLIITRRRRSRRMCVLAYPDLDEEEELQLIGNWQALRRRSREIQRAEAAKNDVAFQAFMAAALEKPKKVARKARGGDRHV